MNCSGSAELINVPSFKWTQLPAVPDAHGFAGSFSGVSNGALIVAGGANFPDGGAPWTGSAKVWHDDIFVLENTHSEWISAGKLPRPLGYGVSITWRDAVICLGGSNSTGHFSEAFMMRYKNGKIESEKLPSLPYPVANTSGVLIGDVIYVAGGLKDPASRVTERNFWSMDLAVDASKRTWKILDTWPGPSRMFAVVGGIEGSFYLFSGTQLIDGAREYLKDAYKYEEGKGWSKLAPLPEAVVAAPSPAFAHGENQLFIYGGDDGKLASQAAVLKDKHPGFSRNILAYNTDLNSWNIAGQIWTDKKADAESNPNESQWAPVTTPLVVWNGNIIIPGGEVRPAVRTTQVLQASPVKSPDH